MPSTGSSIRCTGACRTTRDGGLWYLFRHEDCNRLFRIGLETPCPIGGMPSKVGWSFGAGAPPKRRTTSTCAHGSSTAQDPPDHTRVRGAISQWFAPKWLQAYKPRIEEVVRGLLDEIEADGDDRFDFVERIAYPLPLLMISELMGVPVEIASWCTRCRRDSAPGSTSTAPGTGARGGGRGTPFPDLSRPGLRRPPCRGP